MTTVSINSVNFGSTGKIMLGVANVARAYGYDCITFSASGRSMRKNIPEHRFIGTRLGRNLNLQFSTKSGFYSMGSPMDTERFLHTVDSLRPDILHLHNLHGSYINLPLLFGYIKKKRVPVVWTLHDCWAFTGRCPYFDIVACERWKTGCHDCPYGKHSYPASYVDRSAQMWRLKKKWFTGVENMTIVTPSQWLADLVKQSYLKDYPVKVIHNGIDLSVFCPTPGDFRQRHGIAQDQKLLLGVADGWGERKGLDVFLELAHRLDQRYQIVLVGTSDDLDKTLPSNILSIHRTQNQRELAEIYTAADLFVNPTREEVLGLVNIEALACGTPVITFDSGGSPECIDETCGLVVPCNDIDALEAAIRRACEEQLFTSTACIKRAEHFDQNERFREYVELYESLMKNE